jgi:hypothetical protein
MERVRPIARAPKAQVRRSGGWAGKGRSKYRACPTVVHGFRFASKREAARYSELLLLGLAGEIRNLELQPRFPITVNGVRVADWIGDFRYQERNRRVPRFLEAGWRDVIEDVKGVRTPVYRLKKKLVWAIYGIDVRETR